MRRDQVFRWGGVGASAVLIAFGIVVIVLALNGHNTVTTELKQQKITGTPDMTPTAIKAEARRRGSRTSAIQFAPSRGNRLTPAARRVASPST